MKLNKFINSIKSKSKEIIYYGGSFNPWHEGHSECIRKAPSDTIKIVIPDHNPHKEFTKRNLTIDEQMICSLNKNVYIYKGFFEEQTNNPTVDWLKQITLDLNQYKHSLLIGYDSYLNLSKWKDFELLLSLIDKLYVLNRQNESNEKLYDVKTVFLGNHQYESLSSTVIREKS